VNSYSAFFAFSLSTCQDIPMKQSYTVVLQRAETGWWVANVPVLHATAQGRTRATALKRAKSLIQFALETIQGEGAQPPVENRSTLEVVRVRATV
jgi:predicted RNase H-like HicB family nuclease